MRTRTKMTVLYLAKRCGGFVFSRVKSESLLRILCYHGFSMEDEHLWQPGVFMRAETFEERMSYIARERYPVLPLDTALQLLRENDLPRDATVITMDDGWYSSMAIGDPICQRFGFPYTIYVSSYHCQKQSPVFNMAVRYLFWKAGEKLQNFPLDVVGEQGSADLRGHEKREAMVERCIAFGRDNFDDHGRNQLLAELADVTGGDWQRILDRRVLHLMTSAEIARLARQGVDIQLHTHRHRLPLEEEAVVNEIGDNRSFLEPLVERRLNHFCYPSGYFRRRHFSWLKKAGVTSATTTAPGLNDSGTDMFQLRRFLDFESYPQLLFEAEMSGFMELARKIARTQKNE